MPVWLPGTIYFATHSPVWDGGRAFYDADAPGPAAARAWLVTAGQFADITAQEMYRKPGGDLDLADVLVTGRAQLGPGRYETLLHVGDHDDHPLLTFTAPWHMAEVSATAPSAAYLRMLAGGLIAAHHWSPARAADYLAGLTAAWTTDAIAELLSWPGDVVPS